MKKNAGFTLIELVAVMVILAILAVVAVPQFVDLRVQAADASAAGVGGAIASGTALNYARGVSGAGGAIEVTDCTAAELAPLISATLSGGNISQSGRLYTVAEQTAADPALTVSGTQKICTIVDANGITGVAAQPFTIVGCTAAGTC